MASAKQGHSQVSALFAADLARAKQEVQRDSPSPKNKRAETWRRRCGRGPLTSCGPRSYRSTRLTPNIVDVVVRAPWAARKFEPGQFFRLQNLETHAKVVAGSRLSMEGHRADGADSDKEREACRSSCWKWAAARACVSGLCRASRWW